MTFELAETFEMATDVPSMSSTFSAAADRRCRPIGGPGGGIPVIHPGCARNVKGA